MSDVKVESIKLSVTYKCPLTGETVTVEDLHKNSLTSYPLESGWSDVDNGWALIATFFKCPSCDRNHDIEVMKDTAF